MEITKTVIDYNFWKNKKVLITGHTGFKGSWLCLILHEFGANICGYALDPPTNPSLFVEANVENLITSCIGDIRDYKNVFDVINKFEPEIVIHMAAQPLVRESYIDPLTTYETNVMGTVHLLEACRNVKSVRAIINVTTDKCYENKEWEWGYRENEPMGGYDPYSNSKGCSELITSSYRDSFFNIKDYKSHGVALASARAGNVIGGGDWANDRLIPDFIKSIADNKKVKIRSPYAIRPWQHVLEPLSGYILLAEKLYKEGNKYAEGWNFGPEDSDVKNVKWIIDKICAVWGEKTSYEIEKTDKFHEANYLKLDCSKAKTKLDWYPRWNLEKTIFNIVDWNRAYLRSANVREITERQIREYFNIKEKNE